MTGCLHTRRAAAQLGWLAIAWFAAGTGLAGCLSVPDGPTPMCESTSDCDHANGEVCGDGVCWGNPPPGPFAALISPPSTRRDLVPQELPQLAIAGDGWMGDLALEAPVQLSGRITAFCPPPMVGCDPTTLGATVSVSRASQFHGGPGFKTVVDVDTGASSFSIPVPRTHAGDAPYTVTIVPDGGSEPSGGRSPAERLPPLHIQVPLAGNAMVKAELGGPDLPKISGTLTDNLGTPLARYRVAALGRWDLTAPPVEVSTVDFTDASGIYEVTLSDDLVGPVELVARPTDPVSGPVVHLANIDATKSSLRGTTMLPTDLGSPRDVSVQVTGVDRSGTVTPVSGALVSVTGVRAVPSMLTSFTVTSESVTDDMGNVTLHLLDGAGIASSYRLSITPPASSSLGVMFDQKLALPAPPPMRLASRVALRGKILDATGKPLTNVAVTARPSLRFLWTLDAAPQAFVAAIPAATAVTLDTGEFVVWVDPNVAQVWGHYDLLIEPPAAALAPSYLKTDVEIPRDGTLAAVTLGEITLPDAAFVRGRIAAPNGDSVENAEIKLYLLSNALGLCSEVAHAPTSCPIPAILQGRGTSDAAGTERVALPRCTLRDTGFGLPICP